MGLSYELPSIVGAAGVDYLPGLKRIGGRASRGAFCAYYSQATINAIVAKKRQRDVCFCCLEIICINCLILPGPLVFSLPFAS